MSRTYFTDSVSDLCQGIVDKVDTYEKRIKYLEEENKKLKDEHYKDSEMQRMEAELKKAKQRAMGHGCIGGSLTWCFTPTSIGTIGEVICSCGEKFTFQDL